MKIKLMVAFSNRLFSEGVARLLNEDDQIEISCILDAGTRCTREKLEGVEVILTDFTALYTSFPDPDLTLKQNLILFDTDCGKENIISAVISRRISGVLMAPATLPTLKKAIRSVASGETWIDSATVKDILLGAVPTTLHTPTLSEKEKEVAALTGTGLRNREIAERLSITEPTVKTHLHRIFKKLKIKTRSQLITYSLKAGLVNDDIFSKRKDNL